MPDDDITFTDVALFCSAYWRTILGTGALGLAAAAVYLLVATKTYEATVQVQMAQLSPASSSTSGTGASVEAPSLLVARLGLPTTYPPETVAACGLEGDARAGESLAEAVAASSSRDIESVVLLKVRRHSTTRARQCGEAIFEMIRAQQEALAAPLVKQAERRLGDAEQRLTGIRDFVATVDKSGIFTPAYLVTRGEAGALQEEIDELNEFIAERRGSRLVSPVYVTLDPVSPKIVRSLQFGVSIGLVLGALIAVSRKTLHNLDKPPG